MDDTRNVTKNRQQNVDEEVGAATTLKEDTDGRKEDGENDLANIAAEGVSLFMGEGFRNDASHHRMGSNHRLPRRAAYLAVKAILNVVGCLELEKQEYEDCYIVIALYGKLMRWMME